MFCRTEQTEQKPEACSDEENDQFSTIKRCPKDSNKSAVTTPTTPDVPKEVPKEQTVEKIPEQILEQDFIDQYIYGLSSGLKARALYDYQAGNILIDFSHVGLCI